MVETWARVETSGRLCFLVEIGIVSVGPSGKWQRSGQSTKPKRWTEPIHRAECSS